MTADDSALLRLTDVTAGYGKSIVLRGVNIEVAPGSVVAMLGANGAGKTTLMRAAAGLLPLSAGQRFVDGVDTTRHPAHEIARRGLCLIPDGRGIYRSLSVHENLQLFGGDAEETALLMERFPVLSRRLKQTAGTMSGGEQQMLALGRAYLTKPKIVLLDEVSMGLSPLLVDEIFASLSELAARGISLFLVEQYVQHALSISDYVYVLSRGSIVLEGPPSHFDQEALAESYMQHDVDSATAEGLVVDGEDARHG